MVVIELTAKKDKFELRQEFSHPTPKKGVSAMAYRTTPHKSGRLTDMSKRPRSNSSSNSRSTPKRMSRYESNK